MSAKGMAELIGGGEKSKQRFESVETFEQAVTQW